MKRRWMMWAALPTLLVAAWIAQAAWASHVAERCVLEEIEASPDVNESCARALAKWRTVPWWGVRDPQFGWVPRRAYWDLFRKMTGQDLPADPMAWSAWLTAHPHLVWDGNLKRVVEKPGA